MESKEAWEKLTTKNNSKTNRNDNSSEIKSDNSRTKSGF